MLADAHRAALVGLGVIADVVVPPPGSVLFLLIGDLLDEVCQRARVALSPKQDALRGQAIAPRSSCFLVILFQPLRQRQMDDGPHRWLVDPQPKSEDRKSVV